MGGGSSSASTSSSSATYSTPINLSGTQGPTVAGVTNSTVTLTDQGAISKAVELGQQALSASTQTTGQGFATVSDISHAALTLGSHTVDETTSLAGRGLDNAFTFATNALATVSDNSAKANQAVAALATQNSQSADQNVTALASKAILYVALALGAAVIVPALIRSAR